MATIKDVAREAGVSVTLVSRYINGKQGVGKDSAQAIAAAIEYLHYQPNQLARSLVQGSTNTLAVVVDQWDAPNLLQLVAGIEAACREAGYYAAFFCAGGDTSRKKDLIRTFSTGRADGILVLGPAEGSFLQEVGTSVPVVTIEGSLDGYPCHEIRMDYEAGGYQITRHMLYARPWICLFKGAPDDPVAHAMERGYIQAVREDAGEDRIHRVVCGTSAKDGYTTMHRLMAKGIYPQGILACSQAAAMGAMKALMERGRSIPRDAFVAGFGGEALSAVKGYPALTTFLPPWEALGRKAVETLLEERTHPNAKAQVYKLVPKLLLRESSHQLFR